MHRKWIVLLWTARKRLRLTWSLLSDKRVPLWQKAIPFLPVVYIISPFNFLTTLIPIVGWLDDVMLVMLAMELLERVVDQNVLADYQEPPPLTANHTRPDDEATSRKNKRVAPNKVKID